MSCSTTFDAAQARRDRQADRLAELGEIGMDIARKVHRKVLAQDEAEPSTQTLGDLTRMYERVSRAVRLTFALEARLAEAPAPAATDPKHDELGEARRQRKVEARDVLHAVIEAEIDSPGLRRTYFDEAEVRLEREHEPDFTWRPLGEMVARICRDLGIEPDWDRWDETWADEAHLATARARPRRAPRRKSRPPRPDRVATPSPLATPPP